MTPGDVVSFKRDYENAALRSSGAMGTVIASSTVCGFSDVELLCKCGMFALGAVVSVPDIRLHLETAAPKQLALI